MKSLFAVRMRFAAKAAAGRFYPAQVVPERRKLQIVNYKLQTAKNGDTYMIAQELAKSE